MQKRGSYDDELLAAEWRTNRRRLILGPVHAVTQVSRSHSREPHSVYYDFRRYHQNSDNTALSFYLYLYVPVPLSVSVSDNLFPFSDTTLLRETHSPVVSRASSVQRFLAFLICRRVSETDRRSARVRYRACVSFRRRCRLAIRRLTPGHWLDVFYRHEPLCAARVSNVKRILLIRERRYARNA